MLRENMTIMGKLMAIWHWITCNSHIVYLLSKDFVSKPLIEKIKVLLKVFHRPDAEKELLNHLNAL